MKSSRSRYAVVSVLALLLSACSAPTIVQDALGLRAPVAPAGQTLQSPVVSNSGLVTQVTLAEDAQADNREPINPTTSFSTTSVVHAVVAIKDAPTGSQFRAMWYAEDVGNAVTPITLIDQFDIASDGTRNIDFTLTPKTTWPTGKYRVDIFVNGALEQTVRFTVQ